MVVLGPGEFYFGDCGSQIKTTLGSCVAITLWHPQRRLGGMCHYLLPTTPLRAEAQGGRYADQAMALFLQELQRTGTRPQEFEVKVFGGGDMFPQLGKHPDKTIGKQNIRAALRLLAQHGFRVHSQHVGDVGHRTVMLDLASGDTWLRWRKPAPTLSQVNVSADNKTAAFRPPLQQL